MTARLRGAVGACPTKACGLPDATSTACPKFSESNRILIPAGALSATATWAAVKDTHITDLYMTAKAPPAVVGNTVSMSVVQAGTPLTRGTEASVFTGRITGGPAVEYHARGGRSIDIIGTLAVIEAADVVYIATLAGDTASGCCD